MFALPSVFPRPAVTKGRFPLVTAELTQARAAQPQPRRPGHRQGGPPAPGVPVLPHLSFAPRRLRTPASLPCFPQALARNIPERGSSGRCLGDRDFGQGCGPQPRGYLGP